MTSNASVLGGNVESLHDTNNRRDFADIIAHVG